MNYQRAIKALYLTVIPLRSRKKTMFGSDHDVICFSNTAKSMIDQVIMKLSDTELWLADPCPDCFAHAYIRME